MAQKLTIAMLSNFVASSNHVLCQLMTRHQITFEHQENTLHVQLLKKVPQEKKEAASLISKGDKCSGAKKVAAAFMK